MLKNNQNSARSKTVNEAGLKQIKLKKNLNAIDELSDSSFDDNSSYVQDGNKT